MNPTFYACETAYSCTNETISVYPNTAIMKPAIFDLRVMNETAYSYGYETVLVGTEYCACKDESNH